MTTTMFDVEGENLHLVVPAFVIPEDRFTDFDGASELAVARGDFGWTTGRYAQFDDGTNTAYNRNGHCFGPLDHLNDAAKLVVHTPLNMLHQKARVIGTFVGTNVVDPHGALSDDASAKLPYPWIDSLAAVWKYHFPDAWRDINKAFNQGQAFLSMECVARSLTCMTDGCPCGNIDYPYRGLRDDSYCDALNTPRSRKRLNWPHFVGGAMVVPPALPGWRQADITRIAAVMEDHPEEAELVYNQIAATQEHLDPAEAEFLMALVLAGAFEDTDKVELPDADVERIFRCILRNDHAFDPGEQHQAAVQLAQREAEAGVLVAAGLAVVAADTGRTLLIQRAIDPADPASGRWEWPGGKLEPDEIGLDAAKREWREEVGQELPPGEVAGTWISSNGVYQGFLYVIPEESAVAINADNPAVLNPDDPDSDNVAVVAWWDPRDLPGMPALREECRASADWGLLFEVAGAFDEGDDGEMPADVLDEITIDAAYPFTVEQMKKMLAAGQAFRNANGTMGWPTPNLAYLKKAIQAWGRSLPKDRKRIKRYLMRRANDLKAGDPVRERIKNLKA